jgi:hypothetical protein
MVVICVMEYHYPALTLHSFLPFSTNLFKLYLILADSSYKKAVMI